MNIKLHFAYVPSYRMSMYHMFHRIDESDAGTHNCSSDAVCNDTKGSYNCTCKPGHSCTAEILFSRSPHVIIRKTPINIKLDLMLFLLILF